MRRRVNGVVEGDHGEAYADVQPDRRTWRQRVLAEAQRRADAQGIGLDRWAMLAGTDAVHLHKLLKGRKAVTLDAVEALYAALGLRLEVPEVTHVR